MLSPKMKSLDVFKQILPANAIRNTWRTVRRICMLIVGLKGSPVGRDTGHFSLIRVTRSHTKLSSLYELYLGR